MSYANDPNLDDPCTEPRDWRRDALDCPTLDELLDEGKAIGATNAHAFAVGAMRVYYSRTRRALKDALDELDRLKGDV